MDRDALLAFLLANHKPELLEHPEGGDGAHVFQVWEDGEFTLQKGGSLLGMRNLHMISYPHPELKLNPMELPMKGHATHSYVVVSFELERQLHEMIWGAR